DDSSIIAITSEISEVADDTIEVDLSSSDTDLALGFTTTGSTVSLRSSIYAYIEEHGRTYHAYKAGTYHVPNDELEQERLDLQHHLFRHTMNGALFTAPVKQLHNVLDIATDTGLWAIEIAHEFPTAYVIGTDLSPIQPTSLPPNCSFFIQDCEGPWSFAQKFDLIHGRALLSCFSKPRMVMASIFSALTPGGYFELQDICFPCKSPDGTLEGTSLQRWQQLMIDGLRNLGKDFEKVKECGAYMREAGFVDVVEKRYTWAIGPWVRGRKQKGWSMAILTRGIDWSVEEVEALLEDVRRDVTNWREVHGLIWAIDTNDANNI
ncbi:S-adenosyl-L-methionine-dependent methyltransferase, partial [Stipitochalara longipes BDJ]